jgi:hypothetical protein
MKKLNWTKKDSLRLAIFSAELCLMTFEEEFSYDERPREAIEAAKKVLFKDTKKNRDTAWNAAMDAREAAKDVAWSTDWYTQFAVWAALSASAAAKSAASSSDSSAAEVAAQAADLSARALTPSAKIKNYFRQIVKEKTK